MGYQELTLKNASENELVLFSHGEDILTRSSSAEAYDFRRVFEQFQHMIYNIAYRLLGNHDDALELAQDVFLTIHRKLHTFKGQSSLKTWIYRITLNKAANKLRWWKVRGKQSTFSLQAIEPGTYLKLNYNLSKKITTPEQRIVEKETEDYLQICLQSLPKKYKAVLIMRDIEGLSYDEIASTINVSLGTVKSRIARGREMLRVAMDKII